MSTLIERYDEEKLFASNAHTATVNTVTVASGEGQLSRGDLLMRNSSDKFVLAGASVVGADNPSTKPWHEKNEATGVYTPSTDTVATADKDYYSISASSGTPSANPKTEGFFERSGSSPYVYTPTADTTKDDAKTYYTVSATKQTSVDYGTATAFGSAEAVLAVDCDATSADVIADVYVTGDFWTSALGVSSGYTITEADRLNLKKAGIYLIEGMD